MFLGFGWVFCVPVWVLRLLGGGWFGLVGSVWLIAGLVAFLWQMLQCLLGGFRGWIRFGSGFLVVACLGGLGVGAFGVG